MSKKNFSREKKILELQNISKKFGGLVASNSISFDLYNNEVLGLIGPNGAGKTTLLNLISGIYKADSGTIKLNNTDLTNKKPHVISHLGILRTFQHPRLLKGCDLKTNLQVGIDLAKRRKEPVQDEVTELNNLLKISGLENLDLSLSTDKATYGQRKLIEIIRSILAQPVVLLLDEPAAGLNNSEIVYVVNLIDYAIAKNISVILIEHSMDLVMNVCDRITVLNFGKQITTGTPLDIQNNNEVREAYLGGGDLA